MDPSHSANSIARSFPRSPGRSNQKLPTTARLRCANTLSASGRNMLNNVEQRRDLKHGLNKTTLLRVCPDVLVFTRTFFHCTSKPLEAACSRLLYPLAISPPTTTFHRIPECLSLLLYITQTSPHLRSTRRRSPQSHPESNQQNPNRQYPFH